MLPPPLFHRKVADSSLITNCNRTAYWIFHDAMPNIVDTPLTLIFGMWQLVLATFPDRALVPGTSRNRPISEVAVRVVNSPKPSIQVRFDGHLTTRLNWGGCQWVVQRVHL